MKYRANRKIRSVLRVLEAADAVKRGMPVSYLMVLLHIAVDEGHIASEYAKRIGLDRFTVSHYIANLGDRKRQSWNRVGKVGVGLITFRKHPTINAGMKIFLTAKGKRFIERIFKQPRQVTKNERSIRKNRPLKTSRGDLGNSHLILTI